MSLIAAARADAARIFGLMPSSCSLDLTLLPGAGELLAVHARELPQRDDLCGAFCGALALRAAGVIASASQAADERGEQIDQDAVALAAGSVVSRIPDPSILPVGEKGRRDYRLQPPLVDDPAISGTTAQGLLRAIELLSGERLVAIPYLGPWTVATLAGLFDLLAALERPAALLANLATRHLWGSHPRADQLLDYLLCGQPNGPPPDWEVGHFACLVARLRGPAGSLYALADTYPSLGAHGVHLQPHERLAAAIERREGPAGGVLAVIATPDAPAVRARAKALGLAEGVWDNGSLAHTSLAHGCLAHDSLEQSSGGDAALTGETHT
jgi:Family of unknown function (DUF6885)